MDRNFRGGLVVGDWWSDGTGTLRKERLLRIEGELTLPSVCDDLFAWSSLL